MPPRFLVVLGFLVAGCVESQTVRCGDLVCSEQTVCSPANTCVMPGQLDACANKADGDGCNYAGVDEGVCFGQVCVPAGCGNNIVEDKAGEICDDGNRVSFDGCSADCTSREVCGDGAINRVAGETCDCGDGTVAVPGCTGPNSQTPGADCREDCTVKRCGDGVVDPGEYCDDGNTIAGDGCRGDCAGRWTEMDSKTYLDLFDVWGADSTNVFAVGNHRVLKFDGTEWNVMPIPTAMSDVFMNRVSGSSATDVMVTADKKLFHYNGTSWTDVTPNAFSSIHDMVITSPTDGWLSVSSSIYTELLYRWNGTAWVDVAVPSGFEGAYRMWATSASNVYAIVSNPRGLWRFDGTAWNQVLDGSNAIDAYVVTASSPTDVLVMTGDLLPVDHGYTHFNGTSWQSGKCCEDVSIFLDVGGAANDYILVGQSGRVMHFDGTSWNIEDPPVSSDLNGVWGYAPGHAFIVGAGGTILY